LLAPSDESLRQSSTPDASGAEVGAPRDAAGDATETDASDAMNCTTWKTCGPSEYCRSGACRPCDDLKALAGAADLKFDPPEALTALNANAGLESLRFARAFGDGSKLMYARDFFGGQLWLTANYEEGAGATFASPIDAPDEFETSALKLEFAAAGPLAGYNFFFHRAQRRDGGTMRPDLYGANVSSTGITSRVTRLPAPFNAALPTERWSYNLAVSRSRAFWVVNNDSSLDIHVLTVPLNGEPIPAELSLELANGCVIREFEYGLWVDPDGRFLFLNAKERTADCKATPQELYDLLVVELNAAGQPLGPARPIVGVSRAEVNEMDPSLSADRCWMYFSFSSKSLDQLRVFRAHRRD
jgi:hypothetical protein